MTAATAERATLAPVNPQALPAIGPAQPTICAVWGISPATYYRLLAEDALPVPTFLVGRSRKVKRAEILRAIGANDDAPGIEPGAPVEQTASTSTTR